jgi:hypothetical protein
MEENRILLDIGSSDRPAFLIGIFMHAREIKEYTSEKLSIEEYPDLQSRLFVL